MVVATTMVFQKLKRISEIEIQQKRKQNKTKKVFFWRIIHKQEEQIDLSCIVLCTVSKDENRK